MLIEAYTNNVPQINSTDAEIDLLMSLLPDAAFVPLVDVVDAFNQLYNGV